jgi:hypothetical protein
MQTEPETLTKRVIDGWVMSYHRGAGWYALHSAPIIGINTAAQEYWLRQNDIGPSNNEGELT